MGKKRLLTRTRRTSQQRWVGFGPHQMLAEVKRQQRDQRVQRKSLNDPGLFLHGDRRGKKDHNRFPKVWGSFLRWDGARRRGLLCPPNRRGGTVMGTGCRAAAGSKAGDQKVVKIRKNLEATGCTKVRPPQQSSFVKGRRRNLHVPYGRGKRPAGDG